MAPSGTGPRQVGQAWLCLCAALAAHVTDEALTGFLSVYNPTVLEIRSRFPALPLPVFEFGWWLAGLIAAIVLLSLLSVFVFRGRRWIRPVAYAFAIFMLLNAAGHTLGTLAGQTFESVRFARPMPGSCSSPLLAAASLLLLCRLRSSDRMLES